MATLEKIRSKAGLLVIVVGFALVAFILMDFLRSGSTFFQQSKEKVIIVDGNSVGIQEYQRQVESVSNQYQNSGRLNDALQHQIRESIFQEIVNTILLKEEGDKIGLNVGTEEMEDMIWGNNISPLLMQIPDFQNPATGQFDKNMLIQFLQTAEMEDVPVEYQQQILFMREAWSNIQKGIFNERLSTKLSALIVSGITTNSLDAKAQFEESNINVDFSFATQAFSSIPDSVITVSNSEISKLYEKRKESFKQDEARVISFIAVDIVPSQEDYDEMDKRMEEVRQELLSSSEVADIVNDNSDVPYMNIYSTGNELNPEVLEFAQNESVGSVYGPVLTNNTFNLYKLIDTKQAPDSVSISIISLPVFNDQKMLESFGDSLIQVIKDGKSFGDMALEATGGQGRGELGWQTEYSLSMRGAEQQIIEAAFYGKSNDAQVIKSALGSYLIQVTERTKPVTKYKVADITMTVTPSTETYNKLYNDLNHYISSNNAVSSFTENALEAGYLLQFEVPVYSNQNELNAIENSRQVIRWAFNSKKGSISDIFECNDYFVVATLVGATKEGYRPLADVTDILKREILNKKKGEKIVADLKAKNLSSLDAYAEAMNSTIQTTQYVTFNTLQITGIGRDPIVNAEAILSEVGSITGPFAGNNAVYVLSVTDKKASGSEYDEASIKMGALWQNASRFGQGIRSGSLLQENAKIEDNRLRFY